MNIVFSGKARSGKDTAAEHLKKILLEKWGFLFETIAYADDLKRRVMDDFDLSWDQVYGDLKEVPDERYPKMELNECVGFWKPREILQHMGTEAYRYIFPDFWIKQLQDKTTISLSNYIITDGRFPNEINWVIEEGGLHFRVERTGDVRTDTPQHASETSLDGLNLNSPGNHVIYNDGSLGDFYKKIETEVLDIVLRHVLPRAKASISIENVEE